MKKLLTIAFILASLVSIAQVGDIKKASDSNAGQELNFRRGGGGSSGCLWNLGFYMVTGGIKYHNELLSQRKDNFRMVSLNLKGIGGGMPGRNLLFMPQVRANWGLLSSDFRYFYLTESTLNGIDTYTTFDWQALQLNLIQTPNFNMRVGTGIIYEQRNEKLYNEHSLAFDGFLKDTKYTIGGEIRYAQDYNTYNMVRFETNISVGMKILDIKHQKAYIKAGALFQNYFGVVNNFGLKGGIDFYLY